MKVKEVFSDKEKRAFAFAALSAFISLAFALYNGYLGLARGLIWNGSICVYYLLLLAIRATIVISERVNAKKEAEAEKRRKDIFYVTWGLLIFINVALITPVSLMVLNQKQVSVGLIPAIAMAAYTTYKITLAAINYKKNRKNGNLSIRQLRIIGFIDAIVSVLNLQNTLIVVNGGYSGDMLTLSAITSAVGILAIIAISVISFIRVLRENKNK